MMNGIIGINYERDSDKADIFVSETRTRKDIERAYRHGKNLWDNGKCSKYLIAVIIDGKVVDYNRPDSWNFISKQPFDRETSHFPEWDYEKDPCPYKGKRGMGVERSLKHMCDAYQRILVDEGVLK